MRPDDTLEVKTKKVKEHFYGTPEASRNIFYSIFQVFKDRFMLGWAIMIVETGTAIVQPTLMTKLTDFLSDETQTNLNYGYSLVLTSVLFNTINSYLIEH